MKRSVTLAISMVFLIMGGAAFGQGYYGLRGSGAISGVRILRRLWPRAGRLQSVRPAVRNPSRLRTTIRSAVRTTNSARIRSAVRTTIPAANATRIRQQYGQQYGQSEGGYGQQTPQGYAGYQNYPGYGAYGAGQYGQSPGYGAGAAAPTTPTRRPSARQRTRTAPAQSYTAQPQTSYSTPTGNRSTRSSASVSRDVEQGTSSEVYWDGRESVAGDDAPVQVQQPAQVPTPPTAAPAVRQSRTAPGAPAVQTPRRTRQNVVRQNTAPTPPPPANRNVKWGKEEKTDSGPAMKWGKQDKPAAVSVEPGSSQGTRLEAQSAASSQVQAESTGPAKKFQWGKTN